MQKILGFLLGFFSFKGFAKMVNDGPYVIYNEDQIAIRSVVEGKAEEKLVELKEKKNVVINITFPGYTEWNFSVDLKPVIAEEPSITKTQEKLFVLSDIEGEFEALRGLLLANHIIDSEYNWTFGKGHLIICGDIFDRGGQVAECIWLLYKLEDSAKAAGGRVHTILGNHDIMNLSGDLHYLQEKYNKSAEILGVDYMSLYNKESELGRWLRSKNTIEKIGDFLFLHAGMSPEITELKMPLNEINEKCRPFYEKAKELESLSGFADISLLKFFSGHISLFWYRGYFSAPKATEAEVDATLTLYHCKKIIVGHTIVQGNIGFYYNGKVLGLDVNQHAADHQAALFENERWFKVNDKGVKIELNS